MVDDLLLHGFCRWLGVSREVQPLWLIGGFSALLAMRLGKFPNKLWYFLRKYPAACCPSAFRRWLSLPSAYPYNPTLLFPPFGRETAPFRPCDGMTV